MNKLEHEKALLVDRLMVWEEEQRTNKYGLRGSASVSIAELNARIAAIDEQLAEKSQSGVHPVVDGERP